MATGSGTEHLSGEALFLSQLAVIERVIAFVCRGHHLSATEAEEFSSWVKFVIIEGNYEILTKFEGRSSLRTYLRIVIRRLFLDYRVQQWGKWHPSAEARRLGPEAILLERLMWRDGCPFEEACELMAAKHRVSIPRAELERIAARLPQRSRRRFEGDEVLATVAADGRSVDEVAADEDRRRFAERVSDTLSRLTAGLEIQDRLILAMRFEDGRMVAEIAVALRLEPKPLYRRIARLLLDLRAGFEAEGLIAADVMDLLESPAVSIEWKTLERENEDTRPSMSVGARP